MILAARSLVFGGGVAIISGASDRDGLTKVDQHNDAMRSVKFPL